LVHQDRAAAPASNWFVKGMMGNVLNPKMGIFYVSFLPQFIPAGHSPIAWTFLLVAIHVAIGTIWSLTLIVTSRSAARLLKTPLFTHISLLTEASTDLCRKFLLLEAARCRVALLARRVNRNHNEKRIILKIILFLRIIMEGSG